MEVRAKAIAVFFAIAQGFGALGPVIYGHLIGNGDDPNKLFIGYLLGAAVMVFGGVIEIALGISAEGQSLEDIASPLSAVRSKVADSVSSVAGMTSGAAVAADGPSGGIRRGSGQA